MKLSNQLVYHQRGIRNLYEYTSKEFTDIADYKLAAIQELSEREVILLLLLVLLLVLLFFIIIITSLITN
jgi:hypothetical protein